MFTSTKTILEKANKGHYAIGHFNFSNMEVLQGIVHKAGNMGQN